MAGTARVLASLWLALIPAAVRAGHEQVRGVTLSTHTSGHDWGSATVRPTFEDMRSLGVNWVAIHPYAKIHADGRVTFGRLDPQNPPQHLAKPIREAHALGLKILIKPHLAYWGSPFSWRGAIHFEHDDQWQRFWETYERWIVALVQSCAGADAFVVGTELDGTLRHDARWRHVVASVREHTSAPLTYAANWNRYQNVGFWDALDAIGIQAYFPLAQNEDPSEREIRASWRHWMSKLSRFADDNRRNIVFTELGYSSSRTAPQRPWEFGSDGPGFEALAQACLRAALLAIEEEPRVVGAFLWKWFPQPHTVGRDFRLATPGMKRVIREIWRRQE